LFFECFLSLESLLAENFLHRPPIFGFCFPFVFEIVDGIKLAQFSLGLLQVLRVYFKVALATPDSRQS
jgi:hypothetical protein